MSNSVEDSINRADLKYQVDNDSDEAYKSYIEILKEFLGDAKRSKKSIITHADYIFLIRSNTINEVTRQRFSIPKTILKDGKVEIVKEDDEIVYSYLAVNRVTVRYGWEIIENSGGIDGKMIDKIIAFFKPVSERIAESESVKTLKISNQDN